MKMARIDKELRLNDAESLVQICITDDNADTTSHYVAIVTHSGGKILAFRAIESIDPDTSLAFQKRAMFNGQNAEICVNPRNLTVLSTHEITITPSSEAEPEGDPNIPQQNNTKPNGLPNLRSVKRTID